MLALLAPLAAAAPGAAQEPGAYAARLGTPAQIAPSGGAVVQAAPPFSWRPVARAKAYEFELSADPAFRSVVGNASIETRNTYATVPDSLADGNYFWRVRAIDARERAGAWSRTRSLLKRWALRPGLLGPAEGAAVSYPKTPLVVRWESVPYAFRYLVTIATDPSLASPVIGSATRPVDTAGTVLALPGALSSGHYYYAITPQDAAGHRGTRSRVGSFVWSWPSATTPHLTDLNSDPRVFDPQLSWDPVPGAAKYEAEVNSSADFAPGSKVCCSDRTIGTSLSPTKLFPNNTYFWRVRAIDVDGNSGQWNAGPSFEKDFDDVLPTIPNLHVRDNQNDPAVDTDSGTAGLQTSAPVVGWDPVPGASSYQVQVVPYVLGGCNWAASGSETWGVPTPLATATTAWTPLGSSSTSPVPFTGGVASDGGKALVDGHDYCLRVRARAGTDTSGQRVVSDWTVLGGGGGPAFTYQAPAIVPGSGPLYASSTDYLQPQSGSVKARMPLFTWKAVAGACGYFVVVARDASFTDIIDVARTIEPAYAPRTTSSPRTYPDETTSYYWSVMPVDGAPCDDVFTAPGDNDPQAFQKRSTPPGPLAPAQGADISLQPTFRWTAAEGARDYQLQVSQEPSFGNLLDNVKTAATAYTSSSTYPADTQLYWRVRAGDENGVGLTWSPTRSFRRRLAVPSVGGNPLGGEIFPVLSWSPVQGAVSYGLHVDQVDGTTRDFTTRSAAFTPTTFYGSGVWHWQVRANFPRASTGVSPGGYSRPRPFTRYISAPTGARSTSDPRRLLLAWDPSRAAKSYRIQFSESNSFRTTIDRGRTENTSYAPRLTQRGFLDGGPIYWRVAAVDEGGYVGGWASGRVTLAKRMLVRVTGFLRRGRRGTVTVIVTDAKRHRVRGARVTPRGAGVRRKTKRTGRRGTAWFTLRARTRGHVSFRVDKAGYRPGLARIRAR